MPSDMVVRYRTLPVVDVSALFASRPPNCVVHYSYVLLIVGVLLLWYGECHSIYEITRRPEEEQKLLDEVR